uniref:HEAT repeat-containing protein 6 n=1 Tax=Saccoglossus kowalevskii TaxID=10224 RepID=A0ABM0MVP0_SACKO
YCSELLSCQPQGLLLRFAASDDSDIKRGAIQCIGNMCMRSSDGQSIEEEYLTNSYQVIVKLLQTPKQSNTDDNSHCRLILGALRGLQSILLSCKRIHLDNVGAILAALKVYAVLGMGGPRVDIQIPTTLYPTPMAQYDLNPTSPAKQADSEDVTLRPTSGKAGKGNKAQGGKTQQSKRTKKKRSSQKKNKEQGEGEGDTTGDNEFGAVSASRNTASYQLKGYSSSDAYSFRPTWDKVSSSESEYSDTEGGEAAKIKSCMSKVRQTALGCLHTIIRARAGALAVLSSLLDGSKQYLAAAAGDQERQPAAFTPFSCLAILILNVPYHKLRSGLLTKMVKQIKQFLSHKDHNVRVACLTFLGSIVSIQPQLEEIIYILQPVDSVNIGKANSKPDLSLKSDEGKETMERKDEIQTVTENVRTICTEPSTSNTDESCDESQGCLSDSATANICEPCELSWLVKLCTALIHPSKLGLEVHLDKSLTTSVGLGRSWTAASSSSEPLPVRLEALQVLTQLVKGYFIIVRCCLPHICHIIYECLEEKDTSIQLHAAKLLEELGKAMLQQLQEDLTVEKKINRLAAQE